MTCDVYEIVTNQIINRITESGKLPWFQPWVNVMGGDGACNFKTGKPYSLLNQLMLKHNGLYGTMKQINGTKDENGKPGLVNAGAKSEIVCFWKLYPVKSDDVKPADVDDDAEANKDGEMVPVLRYYRVFWLGDTTLANKFEPKESETETPKTEVDTIIDGYVKRSGVRFHNDAPSNSAYYSPLFDTVVVPMRSQYKANELYYSTAFHELGHSTGAKGRLNRFEEDADDHIFRSESYSKEELVAEITSAVSMNRCGLANDATETNSAAYVQSWLKVLENDKRFIVSAASRAQKAVKMIFNEQ